MSEQLFDVVFFGILQAGKEKELVMQNMAALFKTDAAKLTTYFAGGRKVIKANVKSSTAKKYQAALENIGLVVKIEASTAEPEQTADQKQAAEEQIDTSGISVAPVGANIIENPQQVISQKIDDISSISMAETGADVIENPQPATPQKIKDTSDMSMAEAGSDVLQNVVEVVAQEIDDISNMSMAEVGADIIESPKPIKPVVAPDTSELSLDEEKNQA